MVAPAFAGWVTRYSNCGFIGTSAGVKITYNTYTDQISSGTAAFKGLGFKWQCIYTPPLATCKWQWVRTWFNAGSGDGGKPIPWGNVAAVPGMQASAIGTLGWAGGYTH